MDVNQQLFDKSATASAVIATDGVNASLVTITVKNANGRPMAEPVNMDLWLSDNASGFNVTATTASGAVAGKTDGTTGKDVATHITKKFLRVQTKADGTYQLSITDTAKTAFKIFVALDNRPVLVATLAAASYG